ncbi:MAG: ArdC-like ssDNA-binding domain-containing protein [Solirubrobacterales bacterium]
MANTTRRRLTDDERAQRREQDRQRLDQAARQLLSSDGWQSWVKVRSRNGLGRYSWRNQLLIALQAPDARFVAGFHAWKDLGRRVSKGAKAIRILAPMPLRDREETGEGEDGEVRVLFKSVAVFDLAMTEPIPGAEQVALEPPIELIIGDSHVHLLVPLTQLADELGFRVEQRPLDGGADGWCDAKAKAIVVNAALPANARVRVLVHEIAHALGIGYADRGRARAEVMVDCVTYVVCGRVGLDTGGESIPYVAGWGEDGALDAIQQDAQMIDEVARRIEAVLLDEQQQLERPDPAAGIRVVRGAVDAPQCRPDREPKTQRSPQRDAGRELHDGPRRSPAVWGAHRTPTTRSPAMSSTQTQQPPTRKQLAYLRALARTTGTTFTLPRTRRQASRQIALMRNRPVSTQLEFALDDLAVRGGELPEAA